MKFGIIVFPGSNCDRDCFFVLRDVLQKDVVYLWHEETSLAGIDCVVIPGGFSYGDYLRTGAIARFSPVMQAVQTFARRGKSVIGICNGFQILLEAGLLPGAMLRNTNVHFICKYVWLRVENCQNRFTHLCGERRLLRIPIAHNEGNYYIDDQGYQDLEKNNQIVFRYCSAQGDVTLKVNPNGAKGNIAGIINKQGNVLGMMPHPERCAEQELGSQDGFIIFQSIIKWVSFQASADGAFSPKGVGK